VRCGDDDVFEKVSIHHLESIFIFSAATATRPPD
jgi:hypothetical protein